MVNRNEGGRISMSAGEQTHWADRIADQAAKRAAENPEPAIADTGTNFPGEIE